MFVLNKLRPYYQLTLFGLLIFFAATSQCTIAKELAEEDISYDPQAILLTWQQDPTTTMTIDWHTLPEDPYPELHFNYRFLLDHIWHELPGDYHPRILEYKKADSGNWQQWHLEIANSHPFPFSERMIQRVELTGLKPGTTYKFRLDRSSSVYRFRTMPDNLSEPLRFVIGGDIHQDYELTDRALKAAAEYEPDFTLIGGDIAYANADPYRIQMWYDLLEIMKNRLVVDGNRLIPVVVSIGNHEVWNEGRYNSGVENGSLKWGLSQTDAPFFDALFAFPGEKYYNVLDFNDYLSVIALDTEHGGTAIEGSEQTDWLRSVMQERTGVPHVIPLYHVPGYPSARGMGGTSQRIRENWFPLFEEHPGMSVIFEHHDHLYKRTHPILGEEVNWRDGIVYIGDGAWAITDPRPIGRGHDEPAWYLHRASSQRHFIVGTLHGSHQHFLVVNDLGEIIDEYPETPFTEIKEEYETEIVTPVSSFSSTKTR